MYSSSEKLWKLLNPVLYRLTSVVIYLPVIQMSVERLSLELKFMLSPYRTNISSKHLENQLLIIRTHSLFEKKIKTIID